MLNKMRIKFDLLTLCWAMLICLGAGSWSSHASAQDFVVSTSVHDDSHPEKPVVSRSVTLFHAGMVYDYLENLREVVILQPTRRTIVLINLNTDVVTEVNYDEILRYQEMASRKMDEYLEEVVKGKHDEQEIQRLRFQQHPQFNHSVDVQDKKLKLDSPFMKYSVRFESDRPEEYARRYYDYADWIKRLNYVMNPSRAAPAARLKLNEKLRSINALPLEVSYDAEWKELPDHYRSVHIYRWKLDHSYRNMIHDWNAKISDPAMHHVGLQEYQKNFLARTASTKK